MWEYYNLIFFFINNWNASVFSKKKMPFIINSKCVVSCLSSALDEIQRTTKIAQIVCASDKVNFSRKLYLPYIIIRKRSSFAFNNIKENGSLSAHWNTCNFIYQANTKQLITLFRFRFLIALRLDLIRMSLKWSLHKGKLAY